MPPGSDSRRLAAPCSRVIQNSTQSTLSKPMIWRVKMVLSAKQTAAASAATCPASSGATPGRATMRTPRKPRSAASSAGRRQPLAEQERREQRHPDRVGELERDELAERDLRRRRRTRGSGRCSGRRCGSGAASGGGFAPGRSRPGSAPAAAGRRRSRRPSGRALARRCSCPTSSARPATAIAVNDTTAPIIQAPAFIGFEVCMARDRLSGAPAADKRNRRVNPGRAPGDGCVYSGTQGAGE